MPTPLRLGISSCLLGNNVRYNGGHQLDRYLTDTLGHFVEYIPFCPEVGCGMPIPREPVRLVGEVKAPQMVGRESNTNWTEPMAQWTEKSLKSIPDSDLCGFIFKAKSPSCGIGRVKVYPPQGGQPRYDGCGLFAAAFMKDFPLLPVEDDGRLHDPVIRENFVTRVFTMKRWREAMDQGQTLGNLVNFHTRHKLLLMSCSVEAYRSLGKLVAAAASHDPKTLFTDYLAQLLQALALKSTVKKNINVLQHVFGYFKKDLNADEKNECIELFESYRNGYVPRIVPVTLLNHYVRKFKKEYLAEQVYLNQHPTELRLLNHT